MGLVAGGKGAAVARALELLLAVAVLVGRVGMFGLGVLVKRLPSGRMVKLSTGFHSSLSNLGTSDM